MEQSILCLSPFYLSLLLETRPFSPSNGTTQISGDACCDTAHLWRFTDIARPIKHGRTQRRNFCKASLWLIVRTDATPFKDTAKSTNYAFIWANCLKPPSLIAGGKAGRHTPTEEDLGEQNPKQTEAHVPNKDSKVGLPIPCSSSKKPPSSPGRSRYEVFCFVIFFFLRRKKEVCQRHGSLCLRRTFLIQSQRPHAFIFCFMGLKLNET